MNVFTISAIGIITALSAILLKKDNPSLSICISICGGCILLLMCLAPLKTIFTEIREVINRTEMEAEWFVLLLKSLGMCYITQFSCDCCKDAGETALAGRIELAGKIAIIFMCLPLFKNIVTAVLKFV